MAHRSFNHLHEMAIRRARGWGDNFSILYDIPRWENDHVVQLDRDQMHDEFEIESAWCEAWCNSGMIRTNHIFDGGDHYTWRFCPHPKYQEVKR